MAELQNAVRHFFRGVTGEAQGVSQPRLTGSSLLITLLTLLIVPALAHGQTTPNPPDPLCIGAADDCGSSGGGSSGGGSSGGGTSGVKKWNPGHYLKPQGNHAQTDKERFYSSVTSQLRKTDDSPEIRGAMVAYSWGMVEPTLGNYDFAPIYTHLDYLSERGLKMILTINTKCFSRDCGSLAPADYQDAVHTTPKDPPTLTMKLWEVETMDLYLRLWDAIAVEFDGNPALEMIMGAESTPSLAGSNPEGFSKQVYAEQLKRMYSAQAAAFKNTNVVANINFLSGEVSGLVEHAYQNAVGRGMPDIFDSDGSIIFRGECEQLECGIRDYRGMVPHVGVSSYQQLIGKFSADTDSPPEAIDYGLANKITHYAWVSNESGEDSWPNIVIAIEEANPDGHTACPTAYTEGCD